jgi:hypothetical protein
MLTHVDFLETAIVETYQQVVLLRPIRALVDLIMTIPGVEPRVPRCSSPRSVRT